MQDVLSLLSKFIPPERILKLCFSSSFRFYIFKIPHLCKMRRLFWGGYKNILEGVNLEYCWELIPYIPEYEYMNLEPKGDFDKFMFYIGPFYSTVNITYIVIWAIILEDLEIIKKLAGLNALRDSSYFHPEPFPVYVKYSKILHPAVQILKDSNSEIVFFFTGLKQFCTGGSRCALYYMIDPMENQPVSSLIRPQGRYNLWRNITYLLRYCGEDGRAKIREIMNGFQNYSVRISDQEFAMLTKDEIEFLRLFRKKWTREVYFKLTCLVLPQKNLNSYIRKNAGLLKHYTRTVYRWHTCYCAKLSKRQKIKMIKIMVKNRDFCRHFIQVIKPPFNEDNLLKLKYHTTPGDVLNTHGLRLLDDSSIEAIVSLSTKIELHEYIPLKLWKFLKDLTPVFNETYAIFYDHVCKNLKNVKKYSNQFESIKPFIKNILDDIQQKGPNLCTKRNLYKVAQLYGIRLD